MNIEKAQHDILQVPKTKAMDEWIKEHAAISTSRCFAKYETVEGQYDDEVLLEQFEQTIWFALRVGILLGREIEDEKRGT
jgi:hypothetical protein